MATFYIQLENKLLQISGELNTENISKALGYVPVSPNVTNELSQRVDNITFDSLKDNPFLQDGSGELNIVDEAGNIIAKINAEGIHSVDFIAGNHKLTDKIDSSALNGYAKESWVTAEITKAATEGKVDLTGYATEEWVENKNYLTEHQDISHLANKDEIPTKVSDLENDSNYLTEHQDISHLATKDEVSNIDFYNIKDNPIVNNGDGKLLFVDESGYIGLQLEENGLYVKDVIADGHTLSQKADKSDIPSLDGYATESYVNTNLQNYATKGEVSDLVDMSVVTELQGKVETLVGEDVDKSVRDIAVDVLTETLVSETATEAYDTLAEMSAWIKSHPEDASAMNTAIQKNATDIQSNATAISNLDAAYKAADTKVLTDAQEYTDNINFYTIKDNPIVDGEAGSITFVDETGYIGLKVTEDGIIAKDVVTPEHTLSSKADKTFVEDNYYNKSTVDKKITEAVTGGQVSLDGFATEQWVNEQGFLKEHQDISHLAEKSELPTKTSDLTNDSGFITINDVPEVTVPTKVSELENDSKFITIDDVPEVTVPTKTSELTNDSGYITDANLDDSIMWVKAEGESGVRLKGTNGTATGNLAISAGDDKTASDGTLFTSEASGDHAVVFGYGNTCAGRTTLAQGLYNTVNGKDSVAFGQRNLVDGDQAFSAGQQNEVSARLGVAIGYKNKSTNTDSIAIGYQNTSSGSASVAMGDTCEANGTSSTAMGYKTKATGAYSSTFGENTQATNEGEVAMGLYNKSTTSTEASEQTAFSFGIGTSDTNRVNAFEIKKNGDVYIGDKLLSDEYVTDDELSQKGFLDGEETSEELDDVETNTYVKYVAQTLTDEQKEQVRNNIGAIGNNSNTFVSYTQQTLTEEQQKQARLNIGLKEVSSINYDLNVKAINHRGYSYESPENTIPAYIMSKDKGFTYVEGDVAFTKDNVAVLLHDNTIDRTSNGSGKITDFNYQELLQYDFGSWFSSEYEGVRIPTFKEWILLCKNLGLHPYIELKSSGSYTQAQITQVVNEVAACGMKGKVTYISFNNTFLGYVKNADASARLGFLTSTLSSGNITTAKNLKTTSNEVFLDAKLATLKDSVVDSCISNNIPLEVWTVNTEDEIIKMHSYISGVTSDYLVAGRTLYNNALVYVPPVSTWVPTTGIRLDKTSLTFSSFDAITLVATVEPSNSSEEIVWKSSNTSIATVVNGVVTPIADGSCVITVTSGDFSDSCSVNIAFTRYNITRNLTGCTLSNTEDNVLISKAYYGEIIPNEGYSLKNGTVKITMGGVDITSSAYSNGIINIENVTGDIVVSVACVSVPVYSITRNLVGCTSDKNTTTIGEGNPYNETFTALEDYRLSGATITITMGGADISSMYNDGVLSIPEVTGNIVININAEFIPVYSITRNLVNCSTDSSVTTIKEGESHNENILTNEGYTLRGGNIVITMGGVDISSSLSNSGKLSINAVTGNIVINIEAVEYNSVLPIVDLDLDNVGTDGVIRNIGTGGSTYDATIQTTSTSDTFSALAGTGLTLNNHAYANVPYVLKGTDNFTIICKGKIATKSSQTYQRFFRTDTDAPSWYYSKSNTKLQAKLSGKNSSESTISVLGSLISGVTGTNNGGNSVIFSTDTTTVREIMFTCDGTDIKLYIDGKLSASQPASGLTETAYIGIGDNNPDSKYYAKALEINRFAIYDSVITDDVIAEDPVNIRLTNENLSQSAINSKNQASGSYEIISPYRTNMTTRASTAADINILVNGGKTVSIEAKDKNGTAMRVGIQTFGDDALEALSNTESIYPYIIDSGWIVSGKNYQIPITHKYAWIVVSYPNTSTTVDVNNIDYIQITEVNS